MTYTSGTNTSINVFYNTSATATTQYGGITYSPYTTTTSPYASTFDSNYFSLKDYIIPLGEAAKITLPNGAVLTVEKDGSYEVVDSGKIIYKGCKIREFNRFINASDLLEEFIIYMGKRFDVKQGEILQIPIELFITWLIMKACEEDKDDLPPDILKIEDHNYIKRIKTIPRCFYCGRFIFKKYNNSGINFCNPKCAERMMAKI
jgi:hypothetical protein